MKKPPLSTELSAGLRRPVPIADPAAVLPTARTRAPTAIDEVGARATSGVKGAGAAREAADRAYFREVEADQWAFYAEQVGASTNHLPPDNVRVEHGVALTVDHRTSPTNIGLYMLSAVAAVLL